jgi:hypothetical protein
VNTKRFVITSADGLYFGGTNYKYGDMFYEDLQLAMRFGLEEGDLVRQLMVDFSGEVEVVEVDDHTGRLSIFR